MLKSPHSIPDQAKRTGSQSKVRPPESSHLRMSRLFHPATDTPVNMHDMMMTAPCDSTNGTHAVAAPASIMDTAGHWGSLYDMAACHWPRPALHMHMHIRARVFRRPIISTVYADATLSGSWLMATRNVLL
jgi:hypothetical protein